MPEPIVFVRTMPISWDVLTDPPTYAAASGTLLSAMLRDVARSAEGRRYQIAGMKLVIGDTNDMFVRDCMDAEMRLMVTFSE